MSAEIRGHPDSAKRRLEGFLTRRLVNVEGEEVPPRFLFNPEPNRIAEVVEALEWVYGQKKARVIEFLFSRPNDPVRDFADAFNLRKE